MMALVSAAITHGYGLHLLDIQDPFDRRQALMYTYVAPTISILGSTFGKISMVLFIIRLLGPLARKIHLWLLYSVTGIMIGANVFTVGILLGGCMPMEKSWRPEIVGSCINPAVFDYVGRTQSGTIFLELELFVTSMLIIVLAWNAVMDLTAATFPAYMVWKLELKRSTKWSLTFLMCGGVL